MAAAPLAIKLRCQSWDQLQRLYDRDLRKHTLFLKSQKPPPIGTEMRVDLTIPSGTTISLEGRVARHVPPGDRGPGVDLLLAKIASSDLFVIESALTTAGFPPAQAGAAPAAAKPAAPAAVKPAPVKAPAAAPGPAPLPPPPPAPPPRQATPGPPPPAPPAAAPPVIEIPVEIDVDATEEPAAAAAEFDLVEALEAELRALRALNPFQVLGVGYEANDDAVRAAFNELTKKYHPDRFARYESERARALAGEIFILVREAYRKIGDPTSRATARQALRGGPVPPGTPPRGVPVTPAGATPGRGVPVTPSSGAGPGPAGTPPPRAGGPPPPPAKRPSGQQPAALPLAAAEPAIPTDPKKVVSFRQSGQHPAVQPPGGLGDSLFDGVDAPGPPGISVPAAAPAQSAGSLIARGEQLLEAGRYDEAAQAFDAALRSRPGERQARVGKELARGFGKLAEGDRISAAQCFEAALEIDPMNERAARELSAMRRAATDQRRGLLGKLLGKT